MATAAELLDLSVIRNAPLSHDPYEHIVGQRFIREEAVAAVRDSFPRIAKSGFLLASDLKLEGAFRALVAELESAALTAALSARFSVDLSSCPRLVTIRGLSQARDGRIHCDSESKVCSLLLYLNERWDHDTGMLRVLRSPDDFDDMVAEIPAVMGSMFAFLRSDHSWHGHKPFVGERRVAQVAWLRDLAALERKERTNRFTSMLKTFLKRPG